MNKAIFIDKDGTLVPDIPYNVDPELITLNEGVIDGLKLLKAQGFIFIMISNQSGVARGYFPEEALFNVKNKVQELLKPDNIRFEDFYWSFNHPQGTVEKYAVECNFRKPKPGMILQAAEEHAIDLKNSWMIGDILNDVEAGKRAGCQAVLIDNGNETEWIAGEYRTSDYKAKNFFQAAIYIADVHSTVIGI
ncbi:MAG: D-glycero-alpha-D-manno-heptose-1,7-bisphosphate 7-phosphatase [Janthinobacterium lividum]